MNIDEIQQKATETGVEMHSLMTELYPICRSITGNGVRETLRVIKKSVPMEIHEVPTGTKVFDWTVPKEWNINDAYIVCPNGKKIAEFKKSNIHVLNYSIPMRKKMKFSELMEHLFTLPQHPDWIPYLTSYYKDNWGFCISHREYEKLVKEDNGANADYEVVIDSELKDGSLTYGELYIRGENEDEILISTYLCHPSLCNDNLSGVVLAVELAKQIIALGGKHKFSYRIIFIPETIGAITWLSLNEGRIKNIKHGLVATCCGDSGKMTYKKSRKGDATIDKAVEKILVDSGEPHEIVDFFPSGSDERQFCSPAFDMPVGSLMRTMYGKFPEYHTSADNLDFVKPEALANTFACYLRTLNILENNVTYINQNPKCEPQLGRRGLYRMIGGQKDGGNKDAIDELAVFWVLNQSDGSNSLLDIACKSGIKFEQIRLAADALRDAGLLKEKN